MNATLLGVESFRPAQLILPHPHSGGHRGGDVYRLAEWTTAMERRGLSPATIYRRSRCVQALHVELGNVWRLNTEAIEWFLDQRGLSPRTRYCWLSHLNAFYVWAMASDYCERNPVAKLQRPKLGRLVPHPTPESEVLMAIMASPTHLLRQWIVLMAYAGLRCCEVASLKGEDVDFGRGTLRVLGKGQKPRVIPMHPSVRKELEGCPASGSVFIDAGTGQPYLPHTVSRLVGKHLRAIGATHVRAHRLRHRFATALLDAGVDIAVVAELLGHESIETTRGYAAVGFRHLEKAVALIA